jgi:hypothetical protein
MISSKKTKIDDVRVKYWFNDDKEARLTLNWREQEVTFLGEDAIISLMGWLEKRRYRMTA